MYYIQLKTGNELETIDQFNSYKEAKANLTEYRISDTSGYYYISKRACKHWYNK